CCPALSAKLPTAQASLAETARTSSSTLPSAPGLGLGTTVQDEPSQCSVRVWSPPLAASKPAAQTSHGEISVTPVKVLSTVLAATGDAPVRLTHVAAEAAAGPSPASPPASTSGAASPAASRPARDRRYRIVDPFLWSGQGCRQQQWMAIACW